MITRLSIFISVILGLIIHYAINKKYDSKLLINGVFLGLTLYFPINILFMILTETNLLDISFNWDVILYWHGMITGFWMLSKSTKTKTRSN